jgi:hypothetical protein
VNQAVASLGLADRPQPAPEVLAAIAAAVQEAWPRTVAFADETDPAHKVWRFSGRWWDKPTPLRRERPYARR